MMTDLNYQSNALITVPRNIRGKYKVKLAVTEAMSRGKNTPPLPIHPQSLIAT